VVRNRGIDDQLEEWRSAAACARGRFRPDGYGCYRRGDLRFGFFLEYDRGTERAGQYAAKLAAYYRYRDSGAFRRDYASFPALLIVTSSERAEQLLAAQASVSHAQRGDPLPLVVFLTTTARIDACPEGPLGSIWRSPAGARRTFLAPQAIARRSRVASSAARISAQMAVWIGGATSG
jgi:hypothetical protein